MARGINRQVNTAFWVDNFIVTLDPIEKLLFIYFLTSPLSNLSGVYECSMRQISFDTGIDRDMVKRIIDERFAGRIHYIDGWVYVRNHIRYQSSSPQIQQGIKKELGEVPDKVKAKIRKIDEQYSEPEQETLNVETSVIDEVGESEEERKKNEIVDDIVVYFRERINPNVRLNDAARDKIKVRLKTFTAEELKHAIDKFSRNHWRMQHNAHQPLTWFFRSQDQVDKWLQLREDKVQTYNV